MVGRCSNRFERRLAAGCYCSMVGLNRRRSGLVEVVGGIGVGLGCPGGVC